MRIKVNGKSYELEDAPNLLSLLEKLEIHELDGIAIALNYKVVKKADLISQNLKDGDEIEIIRAVQGG